MLDKGYRERMINQFRIARDMFAGKQPSMRVAEMICEMTA
jgi:hypothetical protein